MTLRRGGCGLYLKRIGAFLFLIVSLPLLALHVLFSPLEQQLIDYAHQIINYSRPAPKESDLIAFTCGHDVYTVQPDGRNLRRIRQGSFGGYSRGLNWSPDGVWLALTLTEQLTWHKPSIYKLRFDGSLSKRLSFDRADLRLAVWTPDGAAVQYLTDEGVWRVSADGGRPTQLDLAGFKLWRRDTAAWSPARDLLIVEKGYLFDDSVGSLTLLAPGAGGKIWEHPVAESLEWHNVHAGFIELIRWSPKGDRIAYRTYQEGFTDEEENFFEHYKIRREVHILNLETREESTIYKSYAYNFQWSPNADWIAMIAPGGVGRADQSILKNINAAIAAATAPRGEDRANQRTLKIVNAVSGSIREITSEIPDGKLWTSLAWSPDSERIAFSLGRPIAEGKQERSNRIFIIRRDGTGMKQIAELDCLPKNINWSPR